MAYDFYCTSCGNKLGPGDVVFNLSEMMRVERSVREKKGAAEGEPDAGARVNENGIRQESTDIYITPMDLKELLERTGERYRDHERVLLEIGIDDIIRYQFRDRDVPKGVRDQVQAHLEGMDTDAAIEAVANHLIRSTGQQKPEVLKKLSGRLQNNLKNWFTEKVDDSGQRMLPVLRLWVEMVYFNRSEDHLYTMKYTTDPNAASLQYQMAGGVEIRGLCPRCHKVIVRYAGKYRHVLIGFLGKRSAGKTSLMVSLTRYMNSRGYLILPDEKFKILKHCCDAFDRGWSVKKTSGETNEESFNVTLFSAEKKEKCIFTFVDIAGELFWGENNEFDYTALKMYPLVPSCNAYILCACITNSGYLDKDDGGVQMDEKLTNTNLENILYTIYDNRNDKLSLPPLAILLTKLDLVEKREERDDARKKDVKPFVTLGLRNTCRFYEKNVKHLNEMYKEGYSEVYECLDWCAGVYNKFSIMTYVSLLWCTPLGRFAETCAQNPGEKIPVCTDDQGKEVPFLPQNRESVVDWITGTIGLTSPEGREGGAVFADIPTFNESYGRNSRESLPSEIKHTYPIEKAEERIRLIGMQFQNMSELDRAMSAIYKGCRPETELNKISMVFNRMIKESRLNSLLDRWEKSGKL